MVILFAASSARGGEGSSDDCERYVASRFRMQGASGYKRIENRCEGLLYQPTSSSGGLFLVSLLAGETPADDDSNVEVSFQRPGDDRVHVKALPWVTDVLYRMDAETTTGQFKWPSRILRENALAPKDLGIVVSLVATNPVVHVPAALKSNKPSDWPKTAILVSNVAMSRPKVSVRSAATEGWRPAVSLDGAGMLVDSTTARVKLMPEMLWPGPAAERSPNRFDVTVIASPAAGGAPFSTSFVVFVTPP